MDTEIGMNALTFHEMGFYGGGALPSMGISSGESGWLRRFKKRTESPQESLQFRILFFLEENWPWLQKLVYSNQLPPRMDESTLFPYLELFRGEEAMVSVVMVSLAIVFYEYRRILSEFDAYQAMRNIPSSNKLFKETEVSKMRSRNQLFFMDIEKYSSLLRPTPPIHA